MVRRSCQCGPAIEALRLRVAAIEGEAKKKAQEPELTATLCYGGMLIAEAAEVTRGTDVGLVLSESRFLIESTARLPSGPSDLVVSDAVSGVSEVFKGALVNIRRVRGKVLKMLVFNIGEGRQLFVTTQTLEHMARGE